MNIYPGDWAGEDSSDIGLPQQVGVPVWYCLLGDTCLDHIRTSSCDLQYEHFKVQPHDLYGQDLVNSRLA